MVKILMVCLGNICRSSLAEGIMQSKVNATKVFVDSAGTGAYHIGNLPDERAIEVARKNGLDITNQRARQFAVSDFDTFDFIYVMDDSNYQNILNLARTSKDEEKVQLILKASNSTKNLNVPDPYYGGEEGFEKVYKMLDEACTIISKKL